MINYNFKQLRKKIYLIGLICFLSSCIQTKKIVYLTDGSIPKIEESTADYSYKIQVGDRLSIKVEDPLSKMELDDSRVKINVSAGESANLLIQQPTLNDFVVDKEGNIDLPLVGNVKVSGIVLKELKDSLIAKYTGYISKPAIKVFMTNYNVSVLGEVVQPGFFQVITHEPTFFDAIALGGGLTDFAERSEVQFIRKVNGKVLSEFVDVTEPSFIHSPYYYIMPNDIIHVRPLKVKKYTVGNSFPLILSTLSTLLTVYAISRTF